MKHLLQFNRFMVMLIAMLTLSLTSAWGATSVYSTGFESCSIGTDYKNTQNYTVQAADGASWTVYYGTVSTSSKISGNNSMHMRLYNDNKAAYLEQTSNIAKVDSINFKYAVSNKAVAFDVLYSSDEGANWTKLASVSPSGTNVTTLAYKLTSQVAKFRLKILVTAGWPSKNNVTFRIDDINYFTFSETKSTVTYDANGVTGYVGTLPEDANEYAKDADITLSTSTLSHANYVFKGWNSDKDATEGVTSVKATGSPMTIYAIWADKEIESVAVSGTPTKTTYESNEPFNPAGLKVEVTYNDASKSEVTEGITWTITPSGNLPAGTTSVSVKATVAEVESPAYVVNGLTVTEHIVYPGKYSVSLNKDLYGIATAGNVTAEQSKTVNDITVVSGCSNSAQTKTYYDAAHIRYYKDSYLKLSVPTGYVIKKVVFTEGGTWSGSISTTPEGYTADTKTWEGSANNVDFAFGAQNRASSIEVIYAQVVPELTADPESVEFPEVELTSATDDQDIAITGANLTENITVAMQGGVSSIFEATPASLTITDGAFSGNINVAYLAEETGEYKDTVILTSGTTTLKIPVSVNVVAHVPVLQSIYVSGTPTTTYTVGQSFSTEGLTVMGKYDEGDDQPITEGVEWTINPDTFKVEGAQKVTVSATALTKTSADTLIDVKVNPAPLEVTWNSTEQGYTNGQDVTDVDFNAIINAKFTDGKYYTTGTAVRVYGGKTFTISAASGYKVTKIVIGFGSGDGSNAITTAVGNYSAGTWTGNAQSVVFSVGGSSGHRRLMTFTVSYAVAGEAVATPTITPSAEATTYYDPIKVALATTTDGAAVYYTLDGSTPSAGSTLYEDSIAVSSTTTINAIAIKSGLEDSEVASKTFTFGPVYASLAALVSAGAPTSTAKNVKVTLTDDVIAALDGTQGVYIDVEYGAEQPQRIELYKNPLPQGWLVGGKLSGTIICPWKLYKTTWELCPTSWDDLTYTAPTGTSEVILTGTPQKTAYIDGEKLDTAGLTVTAIINGEPQVVTEGITWSPATLTLGTTSINIQATYNSVASNVLEDVAVTVSEIPTKTVSEFIAAGGGRCYLIGDVSDLSGTNFTLTDGSGSIYVYKHTLATDVDPVANGDYIKVLADEYVYYQSTTHEAKNVVVVEHLTKPEVHVTSVNISAATAEVKVGKSITLTASVVPANADNKNIIWSTSNAKATVNAGVVTGVEEGEVTITATSEDNSEAFASCVVTVVASSLPDFANGDWVEVAKQSEITAGSYVIVAAAESNYAMKSYVSGNNLPYKACTKTGDMLTYDADFAVFELQDYTDGGLSFFDVNKETYLYSPSTSNYLKAKDDQDEYGAWTLTVDEDGLTIFNNKNTKMEIQENNANHNFSCYQSTQDAVTLYKYYTKTDKIFYNANGGEDAPVSSRASELGVATVTSDVPYYGGYSFVKWTANQDGTGKVYTAGEEVTMSGDITIFAQWEKKTIEGDPVVITFKYGDNFFAMSKACAPVAVNVFNGKLLNVEESDKENITWYRQTTEGGVYFMNASEQYLALGSDNKVIANAKVDQVWTWNDAGYYEATSGRTFIYQEASNAIKNYAVSNLGTAGYSGAAMFLTEYITGTVETPRDQLTIGKLGTYCEAKAVAAGMFEGAEFYEILDKDEAGKNVTLQEVTELVAGMPYIIVPTAEEIRVIFNGDEATAQNNNGLYGWLDNDFKFDSQIDSKDVYFVNGGKIKRCGNNCTIAKNRAYIVLAEIGQDQTPAPGRRRITLGVEDTNTPTGLVDVNANVNANGKFIMDGQMFILRDGKMFNAQGQIVK